MNELSIFNSNTSNCICSFIPKTDEEKKEFFNGVMNVTYSLRERTNVPFNLVNYYVEMIEMEGVDAQTGEIVVRQVPRIVLFDDEGNTYGCSSRGVFNSLSRLVMMYGEASTWEKPIRVCSFLINKGSKQVMNIKIV